MSQTILIIKQMWFNVPIHPQVVSRSYQITDVYFFFFSQKLKKVDWAMLKTNVMLCWCSKWKYLGTERLTTSSVFNVNIVHNIGSIWHCGVLWTHCKSSSKFDLVSTEVDVKVVGEKASTTRKREVLHQLFLMTHGQKKNRPWEQYEKAIKKLAKRTRTWFTT